MGFGLMVGFIEDSLIVSAGNYNGFTDLPTLQVTTAHSETTVSSPVVAC
jgi:hypothetical protein